MRIDQQAWRTIWPEPDGCVGIIDQTLLPHRLERILLREADEAARAIADMQVRGAPLVGVTAAYGLALALKGDASDTAMARAIDMLAATRPTAVNLRWALERMRQALLPLAPVARATAAFQLAGEMAEEDVAVCSAIGDHGLSLIREISARKGGGPVNILTHCNAGWLAFVDIGTATAPIYAAQAAGRKFHVYCDETRPRCQGASLTAWELARQGISHQIIADSAAGFLMSRGEIDMVIVGSDRVLGKTGEVANKIGTYTKAVLAHRHGIPFYVAIPLSTIDWDLGSGLEIPIEDRSGDEVLGAWGVIPGKSGKPGKRAYVRIANPTSTARNPGFDVTPPELITGIITPHGILKPKALSKLRGKR